MKEKLKNYYDVQSLVVDYMVNMTNIEDIAKELKINEQDLSYIFSNYNYFDEVFINKTRPQVLDALISSCVEDILDLIKK